MRPLLLFAALLLASSSAAAQGSIRGTVVDAATGESVPGANVLVQELRVGAGTDADGRFEITGVPTE